MNQYEHLFKSKIPAPARYHGKMIIMEDGTPSREENIVSGGRLSFLHMDLKEIEGEKVYPRQLVSFYKSFAPQLLDPGTWERTYVVEATPRKSNKGNHYIRLTILHDEQVDE